MIKYNLKILIVFYTLSIFYGCSKSDRWKNGILKEEFIFNKAPFPSCHASTIAETADGTLVCAWFGGTHEKDPDVCIYVSRKVNGRWSSPVNVADGIQKDGSRFPTWNPVLYQVPDGELQLYYKIGPDPKEWQGWFKTSNDGGVSWSEAKMLPPGHIGPVKDKPVLVGDRLICPSSTEDHGWQVHFEVTKDFGKTWEIIGPINDGITINAIQPTLLTYTDGRLQVLCRSKNRSVLDSWSKDGGNTWSPMEKTTLPNNNSGIDAATLSDGYQLLVYNHVLPPGNAFKGVRTPLNIAVSKDGINWLAAIVLDSTPSSEFSYPSVIQTKDGLVHVVYTWNRKRIKHVVINPEQLTLTPIMYGRWPD